MGTDAGDLDQSRRPTLFDRAQIAGLASAGAGAIHLAAAGSHGEHPAVARIFVVLGAVQLIAGLVLALSARRAAAVVVVLVGIAAVGGWLLTRTTGISWVEGLQESESPQFADTVCAVLGAIGIALGAVVAIRGGHPAPRIGLALPGSLVAVVSVAAMLTGTTHVHSHGTEGEAATHDHGTNEAAADGAAAAAEDGASGAHTHDEGTAAAEHDHEGSVPAEHDHTTTDPAAWPRAWDPTAPIDFSGVPGVTAEQQARAETLAASTIADLPQFADVATLGALGFRSIGDDSFLDPNKPESLVYQVDGDARTLVSAMFIAKDMALDDPQLVDYGGPLMQWHVHDNLCWKLDESGKPVVAGVTDANGACAPGTLNAGGRNPMVHVWIAPHECGPFAALEGHGAGQTAGDGTRSDQCAHDHTSTPVPAAFDPTAPIDLSGTPGVTPEQQAFAENVVS